MNSVHRLVQSSLRVAGVAAGLAICVCARAQETPEGAQAGILKQADALRAACESHTEIASGRMADALVYWKAAEWALRYDSPLSAPDIALLDRLLARGRERLKAIESGTTPWEAKRGRLVRAYVSEVDGSVQPYGLIVPRGYDPAVPIRLDVVLHGSTRPVGMSEARFMAGFDEGDSAGSAPDAPYIELHPLGRVENCYRWAGETDVFEAIESVCRRYNIDRDRIVLRGMSMGASGTWHLGLKHPDMFVALGPYCGYVDTHRFSETPGMNFVKVGPLPEHQELGLHMLDSVDYAANAGVVPAIAAIGDQDPFFQAHVIMGEAMRQEGLKMVNLISPGTGHVQDPVTFAEQMRQIGERAKSGLNHTPRNIRFVTWTLKYNQCHWVEVLGLERHYYRAEVDVSDGDGDPILLKPPVNITRLALYPLPPHPLVGIRRAKKGAGLRQIVVGAQRIEIPSTCNQYRGVVLAKRGGRWRVEGTKLRVESFAGGSGKRPGIQGPIDDAFTKPFLCVRPTGKAWNPEVNGWALRDLERFTYEWARYFRGDPRVKDDTAVTAEDRRNFNLILFGDPGSNRLIAEALPRLPVRWSRKTVELAGERYPSAAHSPVFIAPSPFARDRYVVVNSGHTFHESELNRLNYLLFPRLGDWAIVRVAEGDTQPESVVRAGYYDEQWRRAAGAGPTTAAK